MGSGTDNDHAESIIAQIQKGSILVMRSGDRLTATGVVVGQWVYLDGFSYPVSAWDVIRVEPPLAIGGRWLS